MTDETIEAAVLNLRSQALGVLGLMKDMARRPTLDSDVGALSTYAAQLAQLEGAMITLQQYSPFIKQAGDEAIAATGTTEVEVVEVEEVEEAEETSLTEDELYQRSPTFRKSMGSKPGPPSEKEE